MKISILAETRAPTRPVGGNGAGRVAYQVGEGLVRRGHDVTLHARAGSQAPEGVPLFTCADERVRAEGLAEGVNADAILDFTHDHDLSALRPDWPITNYIIDAEASGVIPNAIVGNAWQAERYPSARVIPLGIPVRDYPFNDTPLDYVLFASKIHITKGFHHAILAAVSANMPLIMIGEYMAGGELPPFVTYLPEIADNTLFWSYLANARVLLAPCRHDAGGRVLLEAAACGTPTVTLSGTGTAAHVAHGVSGIVCDHPAQLADGIRAAMALDRAGCRQWAQDEHDEARMIDGLEAACLALANGVRW